MGGLTYFLGYQIAHVIYNTRNESIVGTEQFIEYVNYVNSIFRLIFKKIIYKGVTYTKESDRTQIGTNLSFLTEMFDMQYNEYDIYRKDVYFELYDDIIYIDGEYCYKDSTNIKICNYEFNNFMIYIEYVDNSGESRNVEEGLFDKVREWKQTLVQSNRIRKDVKFGLYSGNY